MERKIGEIFEYDGEWYQCLPEILICVGCAFKKKTCKKIRGIRGECERASRQTDGVIFKKLKKVGEPYDDCGTILQGFKTYTNVTDADTKGLKLYIYSNNTIGIEIKQNKEDMEENKTPLPKEDNSLTRVVYAYINGKISDNELIKSIKEMSDEYPFEKNNLKPFSLEEAKQGKPVCTRDGRKARIICFDSKNDPQRPIVALVEHNDNELLYEYTIEGKERFSHISTTGTSDLMMLPEKKEGWINIYKSDLLDTKVYNTKKEAFDKASPKDYVDTIKINWSE